MYLLCFRKVHHLALLLLMMQLQLFMLQINWTVQQQFPSYLAKDLPQKDFVMSLQNLIPRMQKMSKFLISLFQVLILFGLLTFFNLLLNFMLLSYQKLIQINLLLNLLAQFRFETFRLLKTYLILEFMVPQINLRDQLKLQSILELYYSY